MAADGRRSGDSRGRRSTLLASLAEPLAAALDNDARLHEMAALREAAEADRRSLLNRFGRKDVGDTIVGEDSGLRHVMQRVDMVSRSDVPVLILGETGTGKELVARAIHNRSDRHSGPFIRVNCGAIPRELIDSQLFGHEKGSFTGAADTRQGWFERADMGTLFLDEIGELPLDAQVRFLRVLQDGFVERVGGADADSRQCARRRRHAPRPGRHGPRKRVPRRSCGIASPCSRSCCRRCASGRKTSPRWPGISPSGRPSASAWRRSCRTKPTFACCKTYDWPGNIRELGTVIDRAAILGNGRTLELAAALGLAAPRRPVEATHLGRIDPTNPSRSSIE